MDNGKLPIKIYLDLLKAFNTLDYSILLDKLMHYGILTNIFSTKKITLIIIINNMCNYSKLSITKHGQDNMCDISPVQQDCRYSKCKDKQCQDRIC